MTLRKQKIQKEPEEVNVTMDAPQTRFDTIYNDPVENEHTIPNKSRSKGLLWGILTNNKLAVLAVLLVVVIPVSSAFYFHLFNLGLSKAEIQQRQVASVVSSIGRLMIVPKGVPVLATVKNITKLKQQQAFFRDAENGDDLVIFPQSNRAIIYSPSRDLIINVGPVRYPKTSSAVKTSSQASGNFQRKQKSASVVRKGAVTIDVRNGSGKDGLATSVANSLKRNSLYSIVQITDANNQDYKKNLIVDVAKKTSESSYINSLAKSLNATVISQLPNGERSSSADVVVILGAQ